MQTGCRLGAPSGDSAMQCALPLSCWDLESQRAAALRGARQRPRSAVRVLTCPCLSPPQCPSTIGEEKEYNPFLRTHCRELHRALGLQRLSGEDWDSFRARVLKEVRCRKDVYKAN